MAIRRHNFNTSHFMNNIFTFIVAVNRASMEETEKRKLIEESMLKISRMMYYTGLTNKYSRLIHEFYFADHYLYLQSLRFSQRLSYKIIFDPEEPHRTIMRMKLFNLLEEIIGKTVEQSEDPLLITIDGTDRTKHKHYFNIRISTEENGETILRRMQIKTNRERHASRLDVFPGKIFSSPSRNLVEKRNQI